MTASNSRSEDTASATVEIVAGDLPTIMIKSNKKIVNPREDVSYFI